jgi:hypothetical protein
MLEDLHSATTRRDILKKTVFVAPLILTLPASAALAQSGSGRHRRGRDDNGQSGQGENEQ